LKMIVVNGVIVIMNNNNKIQPESFLMRIL